MVSCLFPRVTGPFLRGPLGGQSLLPKELGLLFGEGVRVGEGGWAVSALPGGASFYHKTVKLTIIDFTVSALTSDW